MATTLTARPREQRGKSAARQLRRDGQVPAVVYGHGDETRTLSVSAHDLERLLAHISVENTIIDLAVEGGTTVPALIREVQYHSTRPGVLHIDFYQVHAGERLHLEIPVRLHGVPVGVRENAGVLQEILRDLSVECLPRDIPEGADIDVTGLEVGESIHVRDVQLPNVKILNDPDLVICTVGGATVQALEVEAETEDGVGGDVEPELIRRREDDAKDVPFEHGSRQPE
jgi:large subunit ribosomal protein L25